MPDSTGIRVGLAGYSGARRFTSLARNIGLHQIVYNRELEGITLAFKNATRLGPNRDIKVFTDNQAAIYRLARPSNNPGQSQQIRAIAAAAKVAQNGSTLAIEWVPSHQDINSNKDADRLAKTGSKSLPTTQTALAATTSYAYIASGKGYYFNFFNPRIHSRIQLPKAARSTASAFFQLKLKHGYFGSYLKRFKRASSDRSCSEYKAERYIMRQNVPFRLSMQSLFETKIGR
ncbi:hypothetical protein LSUB1_G008868 [Lachnellula subtilissima]|uniref:RNase H type-1 domain-containing protein n=1 Tax=Lachnellula subtilissima TaxID=602034 RepID=A0A8H8U586_9HELO|nr:hypothetical protein LSUB1_G008868 [Lachnellula subtilissima]